MTDEHWPPRLKVKEFRHDPPTRTVWIRVEHFYTMDFGVEEGDPLYLFRDQDIDRFVNTLGTLRHENAVLGEKVKEYEKYFRLQKKLQEEEE